MPAPVWSCHSFKATLLNAMDTIYVYFYLAINRGWQSQAQKVTVVAFHKLLSQLLSEWLPFLFFSLFFCHFWWQQEWVGLLCISWPHLPQPDFWTPAISYRFKNGPVKLPAGQCRLLLPLNFYYIWGSSGDIILNCLWFLIFPENGPVTLSDGRPHVLLRLLLLDWGAGELYSGGGGGLERVAGESDLIMESKIILWRIIVRVIMMGMIITWLWWSVRIIILRLDVVRLTHCNTFD